MWFISQAHENMDKRIVRQCTNIIRLSNWLHFPFLGTILPIPATIARTCGKDGRTVYGKEWFVRRKEVYNLYDSSQAFLGMELGGDPPEPVIGAKKRKMSYAWVLMMMGVACWGAHWALQTLRPDREPESVKVQPVAPPASPRKRQVRYAEAPAAPAPRPVASIPLRAERDLVTRYEATLPRLIKACPFGLICENYTIRIGSTLGLGVVTGWRIEGDCVRLLTDSPEMPELRLFRHANPLLCTSLGAPVGRPNRDRSGAFPSRMAGGPGMAYEGGLVHPPRFPAASAPAPLPEPSAEDESPAVDLSPSLPRYQPPQPYLPPVTPTYRSIAPGH
jgi:hypothetical protein